MRRRITVEVGDQVGRNYGVSIIPTDVKRQLLLGEEAPGDDAVAVVEFGGEVETVTNIGKRFGRKGAEVNIALIKLGFQDCYKQGNANKYIPSPKAANWCVVREFKKRRSNKLYKDISGWKIDFIYNALKEYFDSENK